MYGRIFDNNYLFLDFVTFVHFFHNMDIFTNFKNITKKQKLLSGTKIILIKE